MADPAEASSMGEARAAADEAPPAAAAPAPAEGAPAAAGAAREAGGDAAAEKAAEEPAAEAKTAETVAAPPPPTTTTTTATTTSTTSPSPKEASSSAEAAGGEEKDQDTATSTAALAALVAAKADAAPALAPATEPTTSAVALSATNSADPMAVDEGADAKPEPAGAAASRAEPAEGPAEEGSASSGEAGKIADKAKENGVEPRSAATTDRKSSSAEESAAAAAAAVRRKRRLDPNEAFQTIFGIQKKVRNDAQVTESAKSGGVQGSGSGPAKLLEPEAAKKALEDITSTALDKAPKMRTFAQQQLGGKIGRPRKHNVDDFLDESATFSAAQVRQKVVEVKTRFRARVHSLETQVRMLQNAERKKAIKQVARSRGRHGAGRAVFGQHRLPSAATSEYKPLDENVYTPEAENITGRMMGVPGQCKCSSSQGKCADETCSNRAALCECPATCSVEGCENQELRKRAWARTSVAAAKVPAMGVALVAQETIEKGALITEFMGEVVTGAQAKERLEGKYKRLYHEYIFPLSTRLRIDATLRGSVARFVNHSCKPNAAPRVWNVDGRMRVGIWAEREIAEGEEITIAYAHVGPAEKRIRCLCGESNCRKFVGASREGIYTHQRTTAVDPVTGVKMGAALSAARAEDQLQLTQSLLRARSTAGKSVVKQASAWIPAEDLALLRSSKVFQARTISRVLDADFAPLFAKAGTSS